MRQEDLTTPQKGPSMEALFLIVPAALLAPVATRLLTMRRTRSETAAAGAYLADLLGEGRLWSPAATGAPSALTHGR